MLKTNEISCLFVLNVNWFVGLIVLAKTFSSSELESLSVSCSSSSSSISLSASTLTPSQVH